MALDDNDARELMRRRLAEDVRASVERDLFRYYRNLFSVVIAVLGVLGITVGWPALQARIDQVVAEQIHEQVDEPVQRAKTAAEEAASIAGKALPIREAHKDRINAAIGRLDPRFDEIQVRYGAASEQIEQLEEDAREVRELVTFLKNNRPSQPVTREEVLALESRLKEVVVQTGMLAETLNGLTTDTREATVVNRARATLGDVEEAVVAALDKAQAQVDDPLASSTVYVQFAGGRREEIERVTEELRKLGWTVPAEERVGAARGKKEIRYYHGADDQAAAKLSTDLETALANVGLRSTGITVNRLDPRNFKSPPAKGILEIWLEIPPPR